MRALAVSLFVAAGCQPFTPSQPAPQAQQPSGPPGMEQAAYGPVSAAPAETPPGDSPPTQSGPTDSQPEDPYRRPPPPPKHDQLTQVAQQMLDQHNAARAKHCVAPLTWSATLAQVAQQWASSLRDHDCAFEHSQGKYGENLAAGTTGYMDPTAVVAMWYGEIKDYSYDRPGFSMQTGHFTQVVWKGTQQVGCGMSQCKGMDVWVCEYDPPGNWDGQFKENVPKACK